MARKRVYASLKRTPTNVSSSTRARVKKRARYAPMYRQPSWALHTGISAPALRGMPNTFKSTLLYREQNVNLNPTLGGLAAQHFFSANGLFDPDITGVGHQPTGFDQLMVFYDHYTVIGSKIIATFTNLDSGNGQTCGIYIADTNTTVTDVRQIIENGGVTFQELRANGVSGDTLTLTMNCNPTKYLGRKSALSDDILRGSVTANPTEDVMFCLFAAPQASVDSGIVTVQVTIEYTAVFTERKRTAIS